MLGFDKIQLAVWSNVLDVYMQKTVYVLVGEEISAQWWN